MTCTVRQCGTAHALPFRGSARAEPCACMRMLLLYNITGSLLLAPCCLRGAARLGAVLVRGLGAFRPAYGAWCCCTRRVPCSLCLNRRSC